MTKFNAEQAAEARRLNPELSIFATGEMLEPIYEMRPRTGPLKIYKGSRDEKTGVVDFDDAEATTYFSVFAHPSAIEDDTTVIQIDTVDGGKYKVVLNEGVLFNGDIDEVTEIDELIASYEREVENFHSFMDHMDYESDFEGREDEHTKFVLAFARDLVAALHTTQREE